MPTITRKIYSPWAFTDNWQQKSIANSEIYQEIKDKAVIVYKNQQVTDDLLKSKTVIMPTGNGYAHANYKILSNPFKLSNIELALICDSGNLCYGYRSSGDIITIHTD